MKFARRTCVLLLMAGLVSATQAEDAQAPTSTESSKAPVKAPAPGKTGAPKTATPKEPAPVPEVDEALLEFLGTIDSEMGDADWLEYLSETDIANFAKARRR